jgi:hypothetical protein
VRTQDQYFGKIPYLDGMAYDEITSTDVNDNERCYFRASIELNISKLIRAYRLGLVLKKGLEGFNAEAWSAMGCYGLLK